MVGTALVGAALAAVIFGLAGEGRALGRSLKQRALWLAVWRGVGWRHFVPAPFVLVATALVGFALHEFTGGWLDWGWWAAIGGEGNVVLGQNDALFGAAGSDWIGRILLMVVAILMPNLVTWEERLFRRGLERKSALRCAGTALAFGLFHLVAGLPIWAALALSVLGLYCGAVYLRTFRRIAAVKGEYVARRYAVLESTRAHVAFNTCGVLVAAFTLVGVV